MIDPDPVLAARARRGEGWHVRPLRPAEMAELQRLDLVRRQAADALDRRVSELYLVGVAQSSLAAALGVGKTAISMRIRKRAKAWTEGRQPHRYLGPHYRPDPADV